MQQPLPRFHTIFPQLLEKILLYWWAERAYDTFFCDGNKPFYHCYSSMHLRPAIIKWNFIRKQLLYHVVVLDLSSVFLFLNLSVLGCYKMFIVTCTRKIIKLFISHVPTCICLTSRMWFGYTVSTLTVEHIPAVRRQLDARHWSGDIKCCPQRYVSVYTVRHREITNATVHADYKDNQIRRCRSN